MRKYIGAYAAAMGSLRCCGLHWRSWRRLGRRCVGASLMAWSSSAWN
ncbi:hypothetical protein ACPA9J_03695 [Pseudomonas aeruginosa]